MKPSYRCLLMTLAFSCATAQAEVSKQRLNLASVPPAVRKTALEEKGNGKIIGLASKQQEGKDIYKLELESGTTRRTVYMDAAGTVLEVKLRTTLSQVSPAAKRIIESSVGNGTMLNLESVQTASGIIKAYEVEFSRNGKQSRLMIGPDGRLTEE
jgi:hypothetical protein